MKNWRSAAFGLISLLLFALSVVEGVFVGATTTLPGALARSTSAISVAITCLSYGHCSTGFESLLAVDRTLHDEGLSYAKLFELGPAIYRDHENIDRAIGKAGSLQSPGTELVSMGPHEKGLALFYLIAMVIFGPNLSSLFYGFMLIFFISIVAFSTTFYRDLVAMACMVGACCAMFLIIPVIQSIDLDVNSVHGSRFLPLLAIIPTMHMVFLSEDSSTTRFRFVPTVVQAALIFLVVFARLSGAWMIIALTIWIAIRAYRRHSKAALLPAAACVAVLAALIIVPKIALADSYQKEDQTEYRTFWHHLLVAANFNPWHSEVTGLPSDARYDDLVAYRLFQKEVADRGESLSSYLMDDEENWPLRTTGREYDYKWGLYEDVVKAIFLRQVRDHPVYVASSFLIFEPIAIVEQLFITGMFIPPLSAAFVVLIFVAIAGYGLAGSGVAIPQFLPIAWVTFFCFSLLPAEASGVMPLRLAEPAFLVYLGVTIAAVFALARRLERRAERV